MSEPLFEITVKKVAGNFLAEVRTPTIPGSGLVASACRTSQDKAIRAAKTEALSALVALACSGDPLPQVEALFTTRIA